MSKKFKFYTTFFVISVGMSSLVHAATSTPKESAKGKKEISQEEKLQKEIDIAKVSETFGHLIGKNLENLGLNFNMEKVVQGLKDATEGKQPPMTEAECVEAISSIQEKKFKDLASENLKKAEEFLTAHAKEKGVVVLEKGKLHCKIEKQGNGPLVEEHFTPSIRYVGKYLDGTIFGSSREDEPLSLDETIPGLSKAIVGMKEGEKRTVYIHPDLAYGTQGDLPPNSLLAFEIEVVKAQAPTIAEMDALSASPSVKGKDKQEIASPSQQPDAVR